MTTLQRRSFLGAMLAAAAAPAIIRASSLMPVSVRRDWFTLYGDGVTDDTAAIQALLSGGLVQTAAGVLVPRSYLYRGIYRVSSPIVTNKPVSSFVYGANDAQEKPRQHLENWRG